MDYLIAIFPPVAVGVLFFFVMRLIFQADRRERQLLQKLEGEHRVSRGAGLAHDADSAGASRPEK